MKNIQRLVAFTGVAAMALAAAPALAQSAEETINIGITVEVNVGQATVSGLEDVSLNINGDLPGGALIEFQTFCLFTPTQFFSLTLTGLNTATGTNLYAVVDSGQPDSSLNKLIYSVGVFDAFSGSGASLGQFLNGVALTGLDSDPFNTDATCSDGQNMALETSLATSTSTGSGLSNGGVIAAVSNGQPHNYTDQLTLLVEPEI